MGIFGNIAKGFVRATSRVVPKIVKGSKSGIGKAFKGVKRGATRIMKGVREAVKKAGTSRRIAEKAQKRALENLMNAP